ncbi:flagellar biosynthetic protein FliO [Niameybacter massiliensis]|uniref:Flagellar biosynthetic protein FliO n=1 Tax=Holtiella tumoricola TaxID=3018743 RepID=A0AA42DP80_9FIRM|nr:flagellar biosynthetic protein FliO [Holtiella tumoricola]MDA3732600.1 flagellar biosynthetic protein FliO [Holtiella tumoricola]
MNNGGFFSAVVELVTLVIIFVGVLALTYFVTKKIAQVKQGGQKTKNLQMIEVLQIGQGQCLSIVRTGKTYHLIGSTKEGISYCKELDPNDLQLDAYKESSFNEYLAHFKQDHEETQNENK